MRQRKETWILTFAGTTQAMQMAVSYTHLDVYKRQTEKARKSSFQLMGM